MTDNPNRRRVLQALTGIGVSGAAITGGTMALFSDGETFPDNELVGATMDLRLAWQQTFDGVPINAAPDTTGDGERDAIRSRETLATHAPDEPDSVIERRYRSQFTNSPGVVVDIDEVRPGDQGQVLLAPHVFGAPGRVTLAGTVASGAGEALTASLWTDVDRTVGEDAPDELREYGSLTEVLDRTYDLGVLHDRRYVGDSRDCPTLLDVTYDRTNGQFRENDGTRTGPEFALDDATVTVQRRLSSGTVTGVDVFASEPFHSVTLRARGPSTFEAPEPAVYEFPRGTTAARGLVTNDLENNTRAPLAGLTIDSCAPLDATCAPLGATRPVGLGWELPSDADPTHLRFTLDLTAVQCR
jgi:predicted ribosomally synthesized peptide with SipW-like signal peptide